MIEKPRLSSLSRAMLTQEQNQYDAEREFVNRRAALEEYTKRRLKDLSESEDFTIKTFLAGRAEDQSIKALFKEYTDSIQKLLEGNNNLSKSEQSHLSKLLYEKFTNRRTIFNKAMVEELLKQKVDKDAVQHTRFLSRQLKEWNEANPAVLVAEPDAVEFGSELHIDEELGDIDSYLDNFDSSSKITGAEAQQQPEEPVLKQSVEFTVEWLLSYSEQHIVLASLQGLQMTLSPKELTDSILNLLKSDASDELLQGELLDLLGPSFEGTFDFVAILLQNRRQLCVADTIKQHQQAELIASQTEVTSSGHMSSNFKMFCEADAKKQKMSRKQARRLESNDLKYDNSFDVGGSIYKTGNLGRPMDMLSTGNPNLDIGSNTRGFGIINKKSALPFGSKRKWVVHTLITGAKKEKKKKPSQKDKQQQKDNPEDQKVTSRYEEVFIPAATKALPLNKDGEVTTSKGEYLVPISEFHKMSQSAFKGIKTLNRMQSQCFNKAYYSNTNLLICAPTGAGKTNVAMTTIAREIERHIDPHTNAIDPKQIKIIYIAPMKALAQEVVEKFGKRLASLGIAVRELTGDMQLTKKQIEATHVVVTTPEKWDVITRKAGDGTLVEVVGLLIIDEVHLIGEDRGPVIESLVARTLRLVEQKQKMIRIVGLSATLPNFMDVALFLKVDANDGLFFFDNSYRPVPLEQTFIGIQENNDFKRMNILNDLAYLKSYESIKKDNQVMVFVHSRKETSNTARNIIEAAMHSGTLNVINTNKNRSGALFQQFKQKVAQSKNADVREFFENGIGIHHAGMLRSDRSLTEKLFEKGLINVLISTATLAWGVNLPAHTVIIKGTKVYSAEQGGLIELSMQDVFQCFGRAGRPQYDTSGEAVLLTEHEQLPRYLNMLNNALPLESQLIKKLPDSLNAEIVSGTVTNVKEACEWLRYTFLYIRMIKNPMKYGITYKEKDNDPMLEEYSRALVCNACKELDSARMTRFGINKLSAQSKNPRELYRFVKDAAPLGVTDLGRVASHFYINHETIEIFNELLKSYLPDAEILHVLCHSVEFQQIKLRDDEVNELMKLSRRCPLPVKAEIDSAIGKTCILFQSYISNQHCESFTLISDMNYIAKNMIRIARAVLDICLKNAWSHMSERMLSICIAIDKRCWWAPYSHPLRQFTPRMLSNEIIYKLESISPALDLDTMVDMSANEIGSLVRNIGYGEKLLNFSKRIPKFKLDANLNPITRNVLKITLFIRPNFTWHDNMHGMSQPFYIWVEDLGGEWLYHSEKFILSKQEYKYQDSLQRVFTIPIFEPLPPQYYIKIINENFFGGVSMLPITLSNLVLPEETVKHTELLNLIPLSRSVLNNKQYEKLYEDKFDFFNPIQTQIFHTVYHTDENYLLGAPTGSGKTIAAELAILRLFNNSPGKKALYIAPLKALVVERVREWKKSLGAILNKQVVEITGDVTPDLYKINKADIIITTPEKFDSMSRMWQRRSYIQQIELMIIDEIHLLGEERGAILEVIISRMRYMAQQLNSTVRVAGLSTALANAYDLGNWLGVGTAGLFNFRPAVRPVPLEAHIHGFPGKHYCPRMASMNKPAFQAILTHSPSKPVLIFVASRRQTRLTALDFISMCAKCDNPKQFLNVDHAELEYILSNHKIKDDTLSHTLAFGIGIHHAGLDAKDRELVETLFVNNKIQILVCTSTLAWGVNFPAHLVIIKGTEYYDAKSKRYKPFPVTDVLQMMGRAGRPQYDTSAVAVIMVEESLKNFYKKFLYEPFPVESHFHEFLHEHINAEVVSKAIRCRHDVLDYISWTYFFRRLSSNPSYYNLNDSKPKSILAFLLDMINKVLQDLSNAGCITIENDPNSSRSIEAGNEIIIAPTNLGYICSLYYLHYETVAYFNSELLLFGAKRVSDDEGMKFVTQLLSNAVEFSEVPVRHNEEKLNYALAKLLPWKLKDGDNLATYESSNNKTFLLLQAYFNDIPLPIKDYINDTKSVLDQAMRVVNAIVDVASDLSLIQPILFASKLSQMLLQGKMYHKHSLLQLPRITNPIVARLNEKNDHKFTSLAALLAVPPKQAVTLLVAAGLNRRYEKQLLNVLNNLPCLQFTHSLKKLLAGGCELNVSLSDQAKRTSSQVPFKGALSKFTSVGFWITLCFVGVDGAEHLLVTKRVGAVTKRAKCFDFQFQPPPDTNLVLRLLCDSLMGLDQEIKIAIEQ